MKGSIQRRAAAFCLTLSFLVTQVTATPVAAAGERARPSGEITSFGEVQVDGLGAASGATVFPGSKFTTAKKSRAIINLGAAGRVRLSPETASTINFGERSLEGALDAGIITVSKPEAVTSRFTTKDVEVLADKDSEAVFTLNVTGGNTVVKAVAGHLEVRAGETRRLLAAGESVAVGAQTTQPQDDDDDDTDGWFWLGVAGFVGGVGGAIIWALSRDKDGVFNDRTPIVISPIRG